MEAAMGNLPQAKILIVDDSDANIDIFVDILEGIYDLRIATNGEQALRMVAEDTPDLILLDIVMPGMDGYEVCRRLKYHKNIANIPIIFVTVKSEVTDEQKGLVLGAVDYITKPFSPPIVKARIRNHLLLKHQRDLLEKSITLLQHEKELLQQKADLGIQAGALAHDMANILSNAILIKTLPRTQPQGPAEWQEFVEDLDIVEDCIKLGIDICHGFTSYLKDIGDTPEPHTIVELLPAINMYSRQFKGELIREITNEETLIKCKSYQIKRVLVNLFVNAMQAVAAKSQQIIKIKTWTSQGVAYFSVTDNGVGIHQEALPDIFKERFTTKATGTGLGLFLTKQIVDAHGGDIRAFSRVNEGAEFVLSFPQYQE